jgi:hypothetical protein
MGLFNRILLFVASMVVVSNCTAQEERYIEVIVSDTVAIAPTRFVYEITIGEKKGVMNFYSKDDHKEESAPSYETIVRMLSKKNFSIKEPDIDYKISKSAELNTVVVLLNSKGELERLYNLLKDEKGISGEVSGVLGDKESHTSRLYSKLFTSAKAQADILAKAAEGDIGQLLKAEEIQEAGGGYMDMIKEVWKKMPMDIFGTKSSTVIVYEKQIRFRFQLK